MKHTFKRFTMFLGRLSIVNHGDQPATGHLPVAISAFACFVSWVFIYWVARPVVSLLQVWWAELLVYALIPILLAFIIQYRSCWHREITGAARTLFLILSSCMIFGGVLIASGIMIILGFLVYSAFIDGFTRLH